MKSLATEAAVVLEAWAENTVERSMVEPCPLNCVLWVLLWFWDTDDREVNVGTSDDSSGVYTSVVVDWEPR